MDFLPPHSEQSEKTNREDIIIISGSANRILTDKVASILNTAVANVDISRFSDGESTIRINESIREKHVFLVQTCAPPVNDNIIEMLLTIAAARRSGATSVTAVIPCFGYYHNRRGMPISTLNHSRFLWNAAGDIAKMLKVVGVDKVIVLDLQRPGQGHEACFFDLSVPVETISSIDVFVDYIKDNLNLSGRVVLVAPSTEFVKKARKFQKKLKRETNIPSIECAVFLRSDSEQVELGTVNKMIQVGPELLGDVNGADVIIVDDYVDSGRTLSALCNRLMKEGAKRVFICASHGVFTENSQELLEVSPIEKVIITDSLQLSKKHSSKVVQISIAPYIAKIIDSDYHNCSEFALGEEEEYEMSDNVE